MKMVFRIAAILFVLLLLFRLIQRAPKTMVPREEVWVVMGTVASLRTPASERQHFADMLQLAKETFEEVNAALSIYNPESELSQLHTNGILEPGSALTRSFLAITGEMMERSHGLFDPTLLPVIQLWGFSGGEIPSPLPTPAQISHALDRPSISDLEVTPTQVRFRGHIDSGGIAKGFALDRAFTRIESAFPDSHFLLNLGGEMRARGEAEPDRAWRIGIQHPFKKNTTIGVINLPDRYAVATSGHYERFFEKDGIRYAHIIDPTTGWPVQDMAGVTVLSPNSTEADVLSTALFVAGLDRARSLLAAFPSSEALLIPDREPIEIYVTDGIIKWFEPAPGFENNVKPLPASPNDVP